MIATGDLDHFRVHRYSQTNEESVLRNVFDLLPSSVRGYLVDVGAGDGASLSNTQLFLEEGWQGCRFDYRFSSPAHGLYQHMITRENIVALLDQYRVPEEVGLLSIDIDGVDLYVLDAMLRPKRLSPAVIVFEINARRQPAGFDVIRYASDFIGRPGDYFGASWSAYRHVLAQHGYTVVHHSRSLNGYAVRKALDIEPFEGLPPMSFGHAHDPTGVWLDARDVFSLGEGT